MKIKEITNYLESLAPLSSQESYDNAGLIVGDANDDVTDVLVSLDCIEDTVQEAIDKGCNLIVAHHPIVFKGLKKLNGKNYIERTVIKAIQNKIAIYAIHTNLDNYRYGVNFEIGNRLGLKNLSVLSPKPDVLTKVMCYVPAEFKDKVKSAMFDAGAGYVGDYNEVSFELNGVGQFKPNENANPFDGNVGELSKVDEIKIELVATTHVLNSVIQAMISAHPYEEVAYDIVSLVNKNSYEGGGMIGELQEPVAEKEFLNFIKEEFNCGIIRHTNFLGKPVQKVAFCGGSGSFLLSRAKSMKADIFITGDFKYHEFFDAEGDILIADIGHFESEQFTSNRIEELLKEKFSTFAVHLTEVNTNPINYF